MQTNILSTQSTAGTNGANAASRKEAANNASHGDAGQFGAMLSSEMMQRQAPMPAPAPAPKPEAAAPAAPKPQAADKPAQPDEAPAPQHAAQTNETQAKAADKNQSADSEDAAEDSGEEAARADAAAKADPAAEMLALMASLKNPAQDAPAAKGAKSAAGQAFDALGGGKARRGDAQLAALQAAMKSVSKDGGTEAAASSGKIFGAAAVANPALAGADPGADTRQAAVADTGADLRNMLATMGKAEARPQLDAADLALQQAREAALQATVQANPTPVAAALAQPAMLEAQAAAAADALTARVGTHQWENQVGQKIVYMVGSEEQTANLTLNPPDLGPMQVVLSISNDQASVTFSSNQLEVRQALENALPRLREMMSESGIALGNASVNAGMPDGRQAQDQQARSSDGFGRSGRRGDDGAAGGVADAAARPVTRTAILGDRGMVDTFA